MARRIPEPGLFDVVTQPHPGWHPPEPPSLDGIDEVCVDLETTGLRWFDGHRPIGIAVGWGMGLDLLGDAGPAPIGPKTQVRYLPFGHSGGNLDEEAVRRWAKRELRGKRIINLGTRFDAHMLRVWGVDLEAQGCKLADVGGWGTLLDDHRMHYSLESLSQDYLKVGKVKGLEVTRLKEYHAAEVAPYAERDVTLPLALKQRMWPLMDEQGLHRVRELEDALIYVVCEMERNGAPLDDVKLREWANTSEQRYNRCLWEIYNATGLQISPDSPGDMAKLFEARNIPVSAWTEKGAPSFTEAVLKEVQDEVVQTARKARRLSSLRSKYLVKYSEEVRGGGPLRYALHQLRADEGGTITGRFSSSEFRTGMKPDGVNIQQVMTVEKQIAQFGDEYIVRELFRPESGLWLSADAKQIEYRLFAHFSQIPDVLAAYARDPETDFHNIVMEMVRTVRPDITRKRTKDLNFAKIFGAGLKKIAAMLGLPIDEARRFVDAYDARFPEVPGLIARASRAAEVRGYVKTILGRRCRFPDRQRLHKALNSIIQGSAADWNKMKLLELHQEREHTGLKMRFTVHDEVDGDVPDQEAAGRVGEILNRQTIPLRVPILWDVAVGENWRMCA